MPPPGARRPSVPRQRGPGAASAPGATAAPAGMTPGRYPVTAPAPGGVARGADARADRLAEGVAGCAGRCGAAPGWPARHPLAVASWNCFGGGRTSRRPAGSAGPAAAHTAQHRYHHRQRAHRPRHDHPRHRGRGRARHRSCHHRRRAAGRHGGRPPTPPFSTSPCPPCQTPAARPHRRGPGDRRPGAGSTAGHTPPADQHPGSPARCPGGSRSPTSWSSPKTPTAISTWPTCASS